jgi:benzil reductase ((S)-benzoin forming)
MSRYFVTGISSGIGHALADHLAARGECVYGVGRRDRAFRSANIHYRQIDLASLDNLDVCLNALFDQCPAFDYAVLNAAVLGQIDYLRRTQLSSLKHQMDVNLWSQKVIIDKLLTHSPSIRMIVAISSGAAVDGSCGWNGYSISKAASKMMIDIYAQEHPDTHFISLAPGLVDTAMHDDLSRQADEHALESIQRVEVLRAQGKLLSPRAFAKVFHALLPNLFEYRSGSYLDIRNMGESVRV